MGIPRHHSGNADMGVQRRLNCSPEHVFAVLRDGWTYPVWVVGASRMRSVDEGWPAPGTRLHDSFGAWPLLLNDTTEVLELDPGQRLVLEAGGRPIGNARVEITVEAAADVPSHTTRLNRSRAAVSDHFRRKIRAPDDRP